jgi:hypothetical protein
MIFLILPMEWNRQWLNSDTLSFAVILFQLFGIYRQTQSIGKTISNGLKIIFLKSIKQIINKNKKRETLINKKQGKTEKRKEKRRERTYLVHVKEKRREEKEYMRRERV